MSIINKLQYLNETKNEIKNAIRDKGVEILDTDIFRNYPNKISQISGGSVEPPSPLEVYNTTRPKDWLTMPIPNDNEAYMLFLIPHTDMALFAINVICDGIYSVYFGANESIINILSGTTAEKTLDFNDYDDLTSDGFKQVMIRITGENITDISLVSHSLKNGYTDFTVVDFIGKLPVVEDIKITSNNLRYFNLIGNNNISQVSDISNPMVFNKCISLIALLSLNTSKVTSMNSMFSNCTSLKSIPLLDTSNVTDMNNMFSGCNCLKSIPLLDTSKVTNMNNMFDSCFSLTNIPLLDTSNVTDMSSMLSFCQLLKNIPLLDTRNVTDMNNMFSTCVSLISIPLLNTSEVTSMNSMFSNCTSLTNIPLLDTSNVTDMSSMFIGCNCLINIPLLNTSKVTNMNNMFSSCMCLKSIPLLDTINVTDMSNMFNSCFFLKSIPLLDTSNVIDMSYIFYNCTS